VIDRYSASYEPLLKEQVAKALFNRGVLFGRQGKTVDERAMCDEIVRQIGDAADTGLKVMVARALFNKAMTFARQMQLEEANRIYDEIIDRFGAAEELALKEQVSRVPADRGVSYHF
jgi:hypothetical protein